MHNWSNTTRSALISSAIRCVTVISVLSGRKPCTPMGSSGQRDSDDRGSIGEWVMILVMAVGIVLFIWSIAQPMLGQILRNALSKLFR